MSMEQELFGTKVKEIRKKNVLSQEKIAKSLGYANKGTIAHIEKGEKEMSFDKILLLLKKYSIDANDFLGIKRIDELLEDQKRIKIKQQSELKDIVVDINGIIFSYQVSGIMINDSKILLTTKDNIRYELPGGHVQIGENTKEAIIRKFKEEMDIDVNVDQFVASYERFFRYNGKDVQQIQMVYKLSHKNNSQVLNVYQDNIDTKYIWIDISQLDDYKLSHKGIIKLIKEDKSYINHTILNDK